MTNEKQTPWLERPIHPAVPAITNEIAIFAGIIILAFITRFYNLGARVMSHDESLHTYFSWLLYKGDGYQHTPMMHGPWQFHLIALSYFLFGVSDFTARIPAAIFNILIFFALWPWRRYLGKTGTILAGIMLLISPYMLYYGRYVREDAYLGFSGIVMLYAILRYLETRMPRYLFMLTGALVLHFLVKETSFIYSAQMLIFLAIYFIVQVTRKPWTRNPAAYRNFIIALSVGVLLAGIALGVGIAGKSSASLSGTEVAAPANPSGTASPLAPTAAAASPALLVGLLAGLAILAAVFFLFRGYTWTRIKAEPSFDLLMLTGTLVLPLLTAFPIKFSQTWLKVAIPTTAPELQALTSHDVIIIGIFLLIMFGLSIGIGLFWKRDWWKYALAFWIPFTVFYTTIFTNTDGFFTGVIGSLGYWLVQQGVQRGSQPWYFYILLQIPMYEFLPALGALLAIFIGLRKILASNTEKEIVANSENIVGENKESELPAPLEVEEEVVDVVPSENQIFTNMFSLLVFWIFTITVALSYAGEKMPWLTYHIAWPMILLAGWGLGQVIDSTDWQGLRERKAPLVLAITFVFLTSFSAVLYSLLGSNPPFQGSGLDQLQATNAFLLPAIAAIASAVSLIYLMRNWAGMQAVRIFTLTFFALLAVLTARAAFRAAYITYDQATEYLVYAHGATGIKDVINQATEISKRTTGGMGINIAYDASAPDTGVSWPFVWYLRDFTNQHSFDQPTRSLRDSDIVIVDSKNFDKIEPALGPGYYRIDYIRMWWPNQDYFGLVNDRQSAPFDDTYSCQGPLGFLKLFKTKDFSRICSAILDPRIRGGILNIWLNRDYTEYADATGHTDLTLATWQPSDEMRMYIKKDVAQQIWKYGALPAQQTQADVDPYQGKTITLAANQIVALQSPEVPMNAPRALAFAADGTFYVADSRNHRILHFDPSGTLIKQWGTPTGNDPNNPIANAPTSTFNEPWGIAVGPDGSVYVADTWNHRIQKFTADGQFVKAWGTFGQGSGGDTFYGPRAVAVDAQGRVYVVDTGNKRVAVFDADGNFVTQFGSEGLDAGQFDEPVGITVDSSGVVYVADTWNQRIQSFQPSADGLTFKPLKQWDVAGWYGQSLDNKPFIAVDNKGHVFITDPEGYRVIEFTTDGKLMQTWGDFGSTDTTFGLAAGVAVDPQGNIWVTDAANNRVMKFTLP